MILQDSENNMIDTASTFADQYVSRGVNAVKSVLGSEQVQSQLKDLGLTLKAEDVKIATAKNLLAGYALYKIVLGLKSNLIKVGVVGGIGFLLLKNKQKISNMVASISSESTLDILSPASESEVISSISIS